MAVTVRLFAALREAAGTSETTADPGPVAGLLAELDGRYGEPFASRARVASVLVDGDPVDRQADVTVADGAEVALLPPFSGGSARPRGIPATADNSIADAGAARA